MAAPKDREHADDPGRPEQQKRSDLLKKKDPRVLELEKDYGTSALDADGDIADETPGHRH